MHLALSILEPTARSDRTRNSLSIESILWPTDPSVSGSKLILWDRSLPEISF